MNGVAKQMKALSKVSLPTAQVSSQYFADKEMVNLNNLKTKLTISSANAIPGNHTPPPVSVAFLFDHSFPCIHSLNLARLNIWLH
jgi:hypothetical protein